MQTQATKALAQHGQRLRAIGAVAMVAALLVGGCSSSAASPSAAPATPGASTATTAPASVVPSDNKPVTLHVFLNGAPAADAPDFLAEQKVAAMYHAAHPNVTVVLDPSSQDQGEIFRLYDVRLGGSDTSTDVVMVDYSYLLSLQYKGYLAPLDEYFTASDLANFVPANKDAGMVDGKFYAAARESSSVYLFVNRDLLKAAGVDGPPGIKTGTAQAAVDGRWTWEQVIDAARKVHAKFPDKYGFRIEGQDNIYMWQSMAASAGSPSPLSPDGTKATGYLTSDGWIKAASWYQGLIKDKLVNPTIPSWTNEPFIAGNEAFMLAGGWNGTACGTAKFDCDVAAHPYFQGGVVATPTDSWMLGVSAKSLQKAIAADFIKFWTTDHAAQDVWVASSSQLGSSNYLADLQSAGTAPFDKFPLSLIQIGVLQAKTAIHRPRAAGYTEFDTFFTQAMRDILAEQDVTTTFTNAAQRMDQALAKYAH